MRCAMVASGTRYASAICRVVSPPTARSVSATAEAGVSDGWAHRKYSCRVSSESGTVSGAGAGSASTCASRSCRAPSDRTASRWRRQATVTSQPRGSLGGFVGQVRIASTRASWTASSAPRSRRRDDGGCRSPRGPAPAAALRSLDRRRLIGPERTQLEPLLNRLAACPGGSRQLSGELEGPLVGVDVDGHPARDQVLGLGEGSVVHRRFARTVGAHERALGGQSLGVDVLPGLLQPVSEFLHVADMGVELLRVHGRFVGSGGSAPVMLEKQVLGHRSLLRVMRSIMTACTPRTEPLLRSRHPTPASRIHSHPCSARWLTPAGSAGAAAPR